VTAVTVVCKRDDNSKNSEDYLFWEILELFFELEYHPTPDVEKWRKFAETAEKRTDDRNLTESRIRWGNFLWKNSSEFFWNTLVCPAPSLLGNFEKPQ
jgi:hypothetical protein